MTEEWKDPLPTAPHRDAERGRVALLIADMINCFDFEGADRLKPKAHAVGDAILKLRDQMEARGAPVIYVNDNFGEWHSEKSKLVERAHAAAPELIDRIAPREADYFIIKPQFSGFYATNLPVLLPKLGVSRLVLAGVAADICVLFTAADAHMRDYALWVPSDAVAAQSDERACWALEIIRNSLGAETASTAELTVADWVQTLDAQNVR